jgi:hypothetical protein
MMKKMMIAAMMLALSGLLGSAYAKEDGAKGDKKKGGDPAEMFAKKDKDGSGKLSLTEFLGKRADDAEAKKKGEAYFSKKDTNADGSLSKEEMVARLKPGGDKKKKKDDAK